MYQLLFQLVYKAVHRSAEEILLVLQRSHSKQTFATCTPKILPLFVTPAPAFVCRVLGQETLWAGPVPPKNHSMSGMGLRSRSRANLPPKLQTLSCGTILHWEEPSLPKTLCGCHGRYDGASREVDRRERYKRPRSEIQVSEEPF